MAGLWMTALLVFFLSVGSRAAVDQNQLAKLIKMVKDEYLIRGKMFCEALSIQSEHPSNAQQLFNDNPEAEVTRQLSEGNVYGGKRLAVAQVEKPEHAEFRVLKDLTLESNAGDLLIIYSYASACPRTCTNTTSPYNIIGKINDVVNKGKWSRYIFVFEKVFKPKGSVDLNRSVLEKALEDLGTSQITLPNIFRCFKQDEQFQCTSCSSRGKVTETCVDYNV